MKKRFRSTFLVTICSLFVSCTQQSVPSSVGKEEADALSSELLSFAKTMLNEHGEFNPYGAVINQSGETQLVGVGEEELDANQRIDLLRSMFAKKAGTNSIRCSGVAYNATFTDRDSGNKTDALVIELEHQGGYNVVVAFPYVLSNGKVEFGKNSLTTGGHHVFPGS